MIFCELFLTGNRRQKKVSCGSWQWPATAASLLESRGTSRSVQTFLPRAGFARRDEQQVHRRTGQRSVVRSAVSSGEFHMSGHWAVRKDDWAESAGQPFGGPASRWQTPSSLLKFQGKICPETPLERELCQKPLNNRIYAERHRSIELIC